MKEKIKKISKYTCNILCFANLLLVYLAPIWGWHIDKISKTIITITGLCGAYLTSGKIFEADLTKEQDTFNESKAEELINEEGSVDNVIYTKNKTSK